MPQSPGSLTLDAAPCALLESFRAEMEAIADGDLVTARVDAAGAALTVIGAMPEIERHRAAMVALFGASAGATLDRLVPIARVVLATQGTQRFAVENDVEPLAKELAELRTRLHVAASALIQRKRLPKKSLDSLTGGQSYQALVTDTIELVGLFRDALPAVASYTRVDEAELARAHELAEKFAFAFSQREQAGAIDAARDRARAFTLFFAAYERTRQMLTYVRWRERDVQQIAPSLFTRSPRKQVVDDENAPPIAPPAIPVVNPTNGNPIPPGMPGADPFTS